MEDKLLELTLKYWSSKFSYAEYTEDGSVHRVPITNSRVDKENSRVIIDFNINSESTPDSVVTKVSWFDDNEEMLETSDEYIKREGDGILYRLILTLTRSDHV